MKNPIITTRLIGAGLLAVATFVSVEQKTLAAEPPADPAARGTRRGWCNASRCGERRSCTFTTDFRTPSEGRAARSRAGQECPAFAGCGSSGRRRDAGHGCARGTDGWHEERRAGSMTGRRDGRHGSASGRNHEQDGNDATDDGNDGQNDVHGRWPNAGGSADGRRRHGWGWGRQKGKWAEWAAAQCPPQHQQRE